MPDPDTSTPSEWLVQFDSSREEDATAIESAIASDSRLRLVERQVAGARNLMVVAMTNAQAADLAARFAGRIRVAPNTQVPDPRFRPPSPFD
jgi:hypothetical protein